MIPRSAILAHWFVFYGTFCEAMSRPQLFHFQLKLDMNEFHFPLATVVSSNQFSFVSAHCFEWVSSVKNVH